MQMSPGHVEQQVQLMQGYSSLQELERCVGRSVHKPHWEKHFLEIARKTWLQAHAVSFETSYFSYGQTGFSCLPPKHLRSKISAGRNQRENPLVIEKLTPDKDFPVTSSQITGRVVINCRFRLPKK
jgi:hypothetical protein